MYLTYDNENLPGIKIPDGYEIVPKGNRRSDAEFYFDRYPYENDISNILLWREINRADVNCNSKLNGSFLIHIRKKKLVDNGQPFKVSFSIK